MATINEELKAVGAKLAKAERRLTAMPDSINRKKARDNLAIILEALIARAHAGMIYAARDNASRGRSKVKGHIDYFNSSNVRSIG